MFRRCVCYFCELPAVCTQNVYSINACLKKKILMKRQSVAAHLSMFTSKTVDWCLHFIKLAITRQHTVRS